MPLERADRRRSQTFKSITVPDEVLQVLDSSSPDHEEEYGETGPQCKFVLMAGIFD